MELSFSFGGDGSASNSSASVCCALHPTGLSCAVGFADSSLKVFSVLHNDLCMSREFKLPNLRTLKFSCGGALL